MSIRLDRHVAADFAARAIVGALFLLLSINLFGDFLRTGHITGLLLLVSESLVVVLTVVRRPALQVDRSFVAGLLTVVSTVGPTLLRASGGPGLVPDVLTAVVSAIGLSIEIAGKVTLGRSFGLIPANRGVVVQGPYTLVRHPIYSGYLLTHVAFLAAHPSLLNVGILAVADTALVVRALHEERVLNGDATYQAYCERVSWHLVPGVF
jgi:protein-S-isoprenylcysteine O-methyltransferase Ste14